MFANLGYEFSEQFRVDGSLRYDHDKRENTTLTPTAFLPNVPGFPAGATGQVREVSFDDWQPKLTLTWMPDRRRHASTAATRAASAAAASTRPASARSPRPTASSASSDIFQAETADTFEAGFKTRLFDDVLSFNGAVFTTKSENSYFFVFLAANSTQNLGNVPETRIDGFELEAFVRARARPPDQRRARHDLERDQGVPRPGGDRQRGAADLALDLQPRRPVDARSSTTRSMACCASTTAAPATPGGKSTTPPCATRSTWSTRAPGVEGGNWGVYVFAANLFDEEYNAEFSPGGFVFKARPRIYGLEASFEF